MALRVTKIPLKSQNACNIYICVCMFLSRDDNMTQNCVLKLWLPSGLNEENTMATVDVKLDRILYGFVVIFLCTVLLYQLTIPLIKPTRFKDDLFKDFDSRDPADIKASFIVFDEYKYICKTT